ncbi:MAG: ABC transporter ATP-binding protein/permease [Bdellovibrionales bacterium]|nr:ABC transporter ATP-binding protein/permease [Bdellovibrionales bacterium]
MAKEPIKHLSLLESEDLEEQSGRVQLRGQEVARLFRLLGGHPGPLWIGILLMFLATGAALLEPRLFGYAIDDAIIPKNESRLFQLTLIYFGVQVLRVLTTIGQGYFFTLLGQRVMQELRQSLLTHLQRLPVSLYDRTPAGRLVTRVTNDIGSLAEMFSAGFATIITNVLTVLGILIWLFILDFQLALVAMAIFPILAGFSIYFSARLRIAYREARNRLSALNSFLAENIMGMRVVQLFARESRQFARFEQVNARYTSAQIESIHVFAYFQPAITWASGISMTAVVAVGGYRAYHGDLAVGVLVAFFAYVLTAFQPLREIADKWNLFLSGMASAERIFSILDWPVEDEARGSLTVIDRSKLPAIRGEIIFENVWFAYSDENWVIRDLSCRIDPGARVGIVGHTGAGKSTIISLLLRFYEPNRGRILLDGRDLRSFDRRELRARLGMIQQEVFLFSGSLHENVTLFREGLEGSAEIPLGLQEKDLYERGVNLSMGERQRLAFYRARAAKPDLWILDEATANVDSTTEQEISALLRQESLGRTQILVAHRLATIRDADLILVLHHGQLVEQGSHDQLMKIQGVYSKMVELQRIEGKAQSAEGQRRDSDQRVGSSVPSGPA